MIKTTEEVNDDFDYLFSNVGWIPENKAKIQAFILNQRKADLERVMEGIKELPSICGKCDKPGINPYGECKCSYEGSKYIKKATVLSLLTTYKQSL